GFRTPRLHRLQRGENLNAPVSAASSLTTLPFGRFAGNRLCQRLQNATDGSASFTATVQAPQPKASRWKEPTGRDYALTRRLCQAHLTTSTTEVASRLLSRQIQMRLSAARHPTYT